MDLIAYLVKKKYLTKREEITLRSALRDSSKKPEELILSKGILQEGVLFQAKSDALNIPVREEIPEKILPKVLSSIPRESVEYYKIAPLKIDEKKHVLEVGMVYPEDDQAQEALKFLARQRKLKPKIFLITPSSFNKYLEQYHAPEREVEKVLEKLKTIKGQEPTAQVISSRLERLVEEAPIIKIVSVILRQAVEGRASDIHIEPTSDSLKIRYRLDGILHSSLLLPMKVHPAIVARIKILSRLKIDETRIPQDGRFSMNLSGKRIDFRVSTMPTTLGEKVCLRVLDPEEGIKSLSQLGLNQRDSKILKEAIGKPYGMILATGPTGCGKSTTLYAILNSLNTEEVNIVTLEDPVEYFIDGINQSQVKPEINYTFAKGLRQILRQDPDIIMVGEIRDKETASLAVHAALTGHLVLSTLHTNSAIDVIPRLIDMGIEPFLIPATLNLVISQRLVRILCPLCKEKTKADSATKKFVLEKMKNLPQQTKDRLNLKESNFPYLYKAVGCKNCNFKGFKGRQGIFEVLKMTDSFASQLSKSLNREQILKEARKQGMISMLEDGIMKALEGKTTLEEVMRVAEER